MRKMILAGLGLLLVGAPAMAATNGACDAAASAWRDAGFASPAKPAQFRVLGRSGHTISGPGYAQAASAVRTACTATDPAAASRAAAVATALLQHAKTGA